MEKESGEGGLLDDRKSKQNLRRLGRTLGMALHGDTGGRMEGVDESHLWNQ